ncbi:MAG: CinA family protein [Clostridia bacterium]|nr:CinA family protein [Clostridia bacterium]
MNVQEKLVKTLIERNLKIATAESCTGGLLSEMITDVSGASRVFECGVCSYSNEIKISVLHVKKETIDKYTEVSVQTAEEMAKGVLEISGADIAVSTTGVAGPTGGTDENPVGTVCIGFASKSGVFSEKKNFNADSCNDRGEIRRRCAEYCLEKAEEIARK